MASKSAACLFSIFVFHLCALDVRISSATCNRQYSAPPDYDCSSLGLPCLTYDDEGSGMAFGLESPEDNTRTCYRTCIDDDGLIMMCEATLTGVHNQALHKEPNEPQYSLQMLLSPNFKEGKNYRKSTICKYRVKCDGDKLLTYSIMAHNLEERGGPCEEIPNVCVDYVKIDLPTFGGEDVTSCGTEAQIGAMNSDGATEIDVEFVANRHGQDSGFEMFVWCSDPGFELNNSYVNSSRRKRDSDQYLECTQPVGTQRQTVDTVQRLITAIPDSRADLTSGTAERVLMNEGDALTYSSEQVRISRGRFAAEQAGTVEVVSSSIRILYVSNRIQERRAFRSSARGLFQGYGELWISGYRAYLLQLGVNPIYRPTDEETEIIMELQMALQEVLKDANYFDVYDELDEEDPEEERGTTPPDSSNATASSAGSEALDDKALLYGTACNNLLRTVACAYQAKIMNRNCITGQMINISSNTTSTEDRRSEPTSRPTEETTRPTEETTKPTRPTQGTTTPMGQNTRPTAPTRASSRATSSTSSPPRRGRRTLNLLQRIASTVRL